MSLHLKKKDFQEISRWLILERLSFLSEKSVKVLWDHFRQESPDAGFQFEKFLSNISDSIHTKEKEKVNMEVFIRNQHETREEEVSKNIRLLQH